MNHSPQNYALWLLGRRDRSIGEIREKLVAKKCSEEEIKEVLKFLCSNNFVNDERFAKNYIQNQLIIKPLGKYQLKMKLKRKLIPEEIVQKVLDEVVLDEEKLAEVAFARWIRVNEKKDNKYEKVCRHLLGRGFDWEVVKNVLEKSKVKLTS